MALRTCTDEGALFSYCQALQAVLAGSAPPLAAEASLSQTFQKHGAASTTHGKQQASAKEPIASLPQSSTDFLPASAAMENDSGAPVLDCTPGHPSPSCAANSAEEQAELLSWHSGSGSESSGEPEVDEDSEREAADDGEGTSMEMEEASCCEEVEEESHMDWDSYDDAVEGFASVPSTPPRKERQDCETPPKLEAPIAFLSDDSDCSDSSVYPMSARAKRTPLAFSCCNESDHR